MLNIDDLFKGRHFDREIIILCVRWYLRYKLSFRDLVEMMAERGSILPIRQSSAGFVALLQSSLGARTALADPLGAPGESTRPISRCAENGPSFIGRWTRLG